MSDIKIGDWVYDKNNPNFYFRIKDLKNRYYRAVDSELVLFEGLAVKLERLPYMKGFGNRLPVSKNKKLVKGDKLICITNNIERTCRVVAGQIVYFRSYNFNRIFFVKNEQDRSIDEYFADIDNFAIHPEVVIEEDIDRDEKYLFPYTELKVMKSRAEQFEEGELFYLISKKDFEKLMEEK